MQELCKSFLRNLKKPFLVFFLIIFISSIVIAENLIEPYNDPITYSVGDARWCLRNGVCTFETLTVYNLSVIGQVFNVTMNLVTWNITESFNVGGNLIAKNGTFDNIGGNGSGIIGILASNVEDVWLNDTGDSGTGNYTFGTDVLVIDDTNNRTGIGTAVIPHGSVGYAKLAIEGADTSSAGPHVQFTTASDDYPLLQLFNWRHDAVGLLFDAYYDGVYRSSDAGSNFRLIKLSDTFKIDCDNGVGAGDEVSWNTGIVMNSNSDVGIGIVPEHRFHVVDDVVGPVRIQVQNTHSGGNVQARLDIAAGPNQAPGGTGDPYFSFIVTGDGHSLPSKMLATTANIDEFRFVVNYDANGIFTFNTDPGGGGSYIERVRIANNGTLIAHKDLLVSKNLIVGGNQTLGQKITFAFGEIIDNIVDGWIKVTGNLGVTGNVSINGNLNISGNLTYKTIYAQLSDLADQSFGAINTKQPINLTTTDESYGIDISVYNITILMSGVYDIAAQPQVATGAGGAGKFHMWLEKHDTTKWVNVSNSNVELVLGNNEENVIPLLATLKLEANEKIRIMGSVSDTAIILDAQSPVGEPNIPSIICRIFKLGD